MRDIFQKQPNRRVNSSAGVSSKPVEIVDLDYLLTPRRLSLRSSSTIDLTGDTSQINEPEVIVLDEVQHRFIGNRRNKIVDVINLDETSKSTVTTCKRIGSDVQCLKIRDLNSSIFSVSSSTSGKKGASVSNKGQKNNLSRVRAKRKRNSFNETPKNSKLFNSSQGKKRLLNSSFSDTNISGTCSSNKKLKRKKKKLHDCTNTFPTSFKPSKKKTQPLSDQVLNYYRVVGKALSKQQKSQRKSLRRHFNTDQRNEKQGLKPVLNNSKQQQINDYRSVNFNHITIKRSPSSIKQQKTPNRRHLKRKCENNIFNPNPLEIDVEGLRPIAIDGSNVAIGHGKGIFSPKGLMICVDYFGNQGHKEVKVFLPLHRKKLFSENQLEEFKNKCDIVFTPSRLIDGKQKTSYDDRFIVQYAVEFGAVIVSTDNYRDLLQENPRWKKTIQERLLMFTWIDDFLMFPMDPMGRNGPTLNEFLRF